MSSLYSDKLSAQQVADLHRELFASLGQGARAADSFQRAPLQGRRLRVGIVLADFHHQHPVNIFMQPVLRELDKSRIELFVYSPVTLTTSRLPWPAHVPNTGSNRAPSTRPNSPSTSTPMPSMC